MPKSESPTLAGAKLNELITDHAQMYVYGSESIKNIHSSMEYYIDEYRGSPDSAKDKVFDTIQRKRIARQAILAALSRVVSDEIIRKALTYAEGETLDIARMTKGIKPTYCDGMINFLEETVDEAFDAMSDPHHAHHELFRHAYSYQSSYLPLVSGNGDKRLGVRGTTLDIYHSLLGMFTINYSNDIASFLVTHGIVIQDQYNGDLPDAETIVIATEETRSHWLSLADLPRTQVGNIHHGKERYAKMLQVASQIGQFPSWSTLWPTGIKQAMYGNEAAFATCPMESPLIHRAPNDPIVDQTRGFHRCAGRIALYGSLEANKNAVELSTILGGSLTETGRYSPAALLVDLGRVASMLSFNDPLFRKALIEAKRVRDERIIKRAEL